MFSMYKYLFLILFLWLPITATAAEDAGAFVDATARRVLAVLDNKELNEDAKQQKLKELFSEVVDVDFMARSALGANWRSLDPNTAAQYCQTYHAYLLSLYVPKFRHYHAHRYTIKGVTERGQGQYAISMSVSSPDNDTNINLTYLLASSGATFKIHDIIAENVSLLSTQRSDFSSVLKHSGIHSLIDMLQAKVNNNTKSSS